MMQTLFCIVLQVEWKGQDSLCFQYYKIGFVKLCLLYKLCCRRLTLILGPLLTGILNRKWQLYGSILAKVTVSYKFRGSVLIP